MAESLEASKFRIEYAKRGHVHECEALGVKRYTLPTDGKGKYEATGGGRPMRYVSLHHHTTYSYGDGYALPEAHVRRGAELGMGAMAVTEHGNIGSHVDMEKACAKMPVKPIFGCEIYMGPVKDGVGTTQRKNHLTVIAMNQEGYRNLLRLVSRGFQQYYYEMTVSFADLEEFNEGLIILSGCTGSWLSTSLTGGKNVLPEDASYELARGVAKKFKRVFGDRYYLECQAFPELENVRTINQAWERMGAELGIQLVATGDVHYTTPLESELQKILHNVRGGNKKTMEEMEREWGYDVPLCPPTSDLYILKRLIGTGLSRPAALRAVLATEEIASRCNVILPKMAPVEFPLPAPYTDKMKYWQDQLLAGWKFRRIAEKPNPGEYVKRLKMERGQIDHRPGYLDYFLIESDMIKAAKGMNILVGPGRGSAAASLICYLLRITEVDPMLYEDLLFERFIDVTRVDMPDIDTDYDDERRNEMLDYASAKYGGSQVGNICSYTKYKSKLALDDVARVYGVPAWQVQKIKDLLVERSSGDLRASATIEDTMMMFEDAAEIFKENPDLGAAMDLEGNVKGMGVHAAGIVIGTGPLTDICAVYERMVKGNLYRVMSVDKYTAEYLNLMKLDNLGLTTLGMIRHCLDMIGKNIEWLYEIPLDDSKTLEGFRNNDVVGVFQFDGRAMRNVNGELKPDDFLEVACVTALARPGPLHNGATAEYIDIKKGLKKPREYHPAIAPIVGKTHGQIVYQEQILRICGEVGGFDHTHRATIRRIISRKLGEQEFNQWFERFAAGAAARGVSNPDAKEIWNSCITAGSYAFNVAHSIGYGMIAWWTMYLKQHHPVEFYTACLRKYTNKNKKTGKNQQLDLMKDAMAHGLKILPPSLKTPSITWKPGLKSIRAGLIQVDGIGDVTAPLILNYLQEHKCKGWRELTAIKGIGPKTCDKIEMFIRSDDPFEIRRIDRKIDTAVQAIKAKRLGYLPWPTHKSIDIPYSRQDHNVHVIWIGELIERNLKELFELHFSRTGEVLNPEDVRDPHLNEWVVMTGDDGTDLLSLTINRWNYARLRDVVWKARLGKDLVLIKGHKKGIQARRAVYIDDMWTLSERDPEQERPTAADDLEVMEFA